MSLWGAPCRIYLYVVKPVSISILWALTAPSPKCESSIQDIFTIPCFESWKQIQ